MKTNVIDLEFPTFVLYKHKKFCLQVLKVLLQCYIVRAKLYIYYKLISYTQMVLFLVV